MQNVIRSFDFFIYTYYFINIAVHVHLIYILSTVFHNYNIELKKNTNTKFKNTQYGLKTPRKTLEIFFLFF